jgi:hypothetical protein
MRTAFWKSLLVLVAGIAVVITVLAGLSLNFPRLLGRERVWDLNTGEFYDAVFLCNIRVSHRQESSGLEAIFEEQVRAGQTGFPRVVIYSNSILQPPRGGQWMRIAHLAGRFVADGTNFATLDRQRLLTLIHSHDDIELLRWYNQGNPPR